MLLNRSNEARLPDSILQKHRQQSGKLLMAGFLKWEISKEPGNEMKKFSVNIFPEMCNFQPFTDETYKYVASSAYSAHIVLITANNEVLTFGQNDSGQLGHGYTSSVCKVPTRIQKLEELNIISAATGCRHTLFLTDTGSVYACGDNSKGQCGIGCETEKVLVPKLIEYWGPPIVKIGCGAYFSVILNIKGTLYTFGNPESEYGQFGKITSSTKTHHVETYWLKKFINARNRNVVNPLIEINVTDFNCESNHTVAIDIEKRVYSWGFGGYGQNDELISGLLNKYFHVTYRPSKMDIGKVYCGISYRVAMINSNQELMVKPVFRLCGWTMRNIEFSSSSELALSSIHAKSSKLVKDMDEMEVIQVAMSVSATFVLVKVDQNDKETQKTCTKI